MNFLQRQAREGQENRKTIYLFIIRYINQHGYSPSIRDIAEGVGLSSTATVHKHIEGLIEDGLLATDHPGASRAIRVVGYGLRKIKTDNAK